MPQSSHISRLAAFPTFCSVHRRSLTRLYFAAPSIRETGRWSRSAPRGRNALIDSADVVDAAVEVLSDSAKRAQRHVLTGPIALTRTEAAARLTKVPGRPIRYDAVSIEERRAQLEAVGLAAWRIVEEYVERNRAAFSRFRSPSTAR